MVKRIIDLLIIAAGQWHQYGDERYERQFESLFKRLQQITGKSHKEVEGMLIASLEEKEGLAN